MLLWRSRAGRLSLALRVAALAALGACTEDQPITAPLAQPSMASVVVGDVAATVDDSTRITFTINPQAVVYPDNAGGKINVFGTATCSRVTNQVVPLYVRAEQKQPGQQLGAGAALTSVACITTNVQGVALWVSAFADYFDGGKAIVSIEVNNPPSGVALSSASRPVRLVPYGGR